MKVLLRTVAVVVIVSVVAVNSVQGQSASTAVIHGRVVNAASKTPIGAATVDVATVGGTAPTARASTTADGTFRIQGLRAGRYRAQIRALGYKPWDIPTITIVASSPTVDLGTIALTAAPLELQALEITSKRQDVQLAPDRNTYVVRDMPTTKGGNVLDVLRNVPSVDVDIDNIVSLRGNSGVTVQINGRPSPMKPGQLGNYLAQLPADMVDKVEVIPNPSARDDPTGVAGIINIVLKQETDAGTSGGLTMAGGTTGQVNVGGNLGYERGPLSFYGSYGFLRDRRPRREAIYRENLYLDPLTYLEESVTRLQEPLAHTLTGSASYKLSKQDELSLDMLFSTRNQDESFGVLYRDLDASRSITALSDRSTTGRGHESSFETALGYKHAFAAKGHKFSTELNLVRDKEGGPSSVAQRTLSLSGSPLGPSALENQTAWEHPQENYLKADYTRPLASGVRMETGYKGSLQRFHTTLDTHVFDDAVGTYLPDTSRISDFTYDQLVNAAYGMVSAVRGKFQLQGGLRAEHASTQFHLTARNSTFDNGYNSVFPSALIAYNVDETHQVKLSYSTRIRRPDDTDQIDPTRHYADPLNVSQGNPNLRPEYIRAFELGLQRTAEHLTLQLTPFWRHTLDAVRTIRTIDSAGVSTRTFANVATSDAYGADGTVALSGGRLGGFAGASAFRQVSNASNLAAGLSARTFGWRLRTNASYRVSSTFDLQTLLSYQAAMDVEQGHNASRTQFSLAARKKLMADQLNLTLRAIDPFNTSRESSTTIDPLFYQVSDRTRAIRGLLFSVSWTFGKPQKEQRDPTDPGGGNAGPP
ncbi:MAG: TonB-dependent receptor [Gemmatimonadetes bacterium]|nr:TonB-dependent receptor [Gemmatimonadota bacterium]